jgi:hypothetical protein
VNDAELDDRIHDLLRAIGDIAPPAPPFPATIGDARPAPADYVAFRAPRPAMKTRTKAVLAAAVALVVVAVGVLAWSRGIEGSAPPAEPPSVVTGEGVEVVHQVWSYTQNAYLNCPDGETDNGGFSSFEFETWTDVDGTRIRQDVVYPDGSERSILLLNATSFPPNAPLFSGTPHGQVVGCKGVLNFLTEPATLGLETFGSPFGSQGAPPASLVSGPQSDSTGRPAELWSYRSTGGRIESIGSLDQTMEYYLAPDTRALLERSLTQTIGDYGTVVQRYTLVSYENITVEGSIFDDAAFAAGASTSGTVPASVFQEEGTCARGGSASVCVIRRDGGLSVKAAGLEPDSDVELTLNVGGNRISRRVTAGPAGIIDTQPLLEAIDPPRAIVIVGVSGTAADQYPLNNSISLYP